MMVTEQDRRREWEMNRLTELLLTGYTWRKVRDFMHLSKHAGLVSAAWSCNGELETLRLCIFPEDHRTQFTQEPWCGEGFRHYLDPKIVCIRLCDIRKYGKINS